MTRSLRAIATSMTFLILTSGLSAQSLDLQWAIGISSSTAMYSRIVKAAPNGGLYVSGTLQGTVDMDPGPGVATLVADTGFGGGATFVAKYDATGSHVFSFTLESFVKDLIIDASGEFLIAGSFNGTVDLDPSASDLLLTSVGLADCYVARYSSMGAFVGAFRFGDVNGEYVNRIAIDANGDLHAFGEFDDLIDLDPSSGSFILNTGNSDDIFLAQFSAAGILLDGFALESQDLDDLLIDNNGDILINGSLLDPLDLDPGPGTTILTTQGGIDGFWARYDDAYNFIEGYGYDGDINDLALDWQGNLYIAGRMPDSMDVDLGPGVAMLYSENNFDVYYVKYDANLAHVHSQVFESNAIYLQTELAVDDQERLYLCGRFSDTLDLDPTGGGGELISQGANDGFLARFGSNVDLAASFGDIDNDVVKDLDLGSSGELFTLGDYNGTIDMDLSSATSLLTSSSTGGIFFAKYQDPNTSIAEGAIADHPWGLIGLDDQISLDLSAYDTALLLQVRELSGRLVYEKSLARGAAMQLDLEVGSTRVLLVSVVAADSWQTRKVVVW